MSILVFKYEILCQLSKAAKSSNSQLIQLFFSLSEYILINFIMNMIKLGYLIIEN